MFQLFPDIRKRFFIFLVIEKTIPFPARSRSFFPECLYISQKIKNLLQNIPDLFRELPDKTCNPARKKCFLFFIRMTENCLLRICQLLRRCLGCIFHCRKRRCHFPVFYPFLRRVFLHRLFKIRGIFFFFLQMQFLSKSKNPHIRVESLFRGICTEPQQTAKPPDPDLQLQIFFMVGTFHTIHEWTK